MHTDGKAKSVEEFCKDHPTDTMYDSYGDVVAKCTNLRSD